MVEGQGSRPHGPDRPETTMTLDQLRVFVAVAERQHVTQAAEALHLAQSAVSAHIATLEGRHDARLFERVGRGVRLTESGATFLVEAKAVLAQVDRAELVLAEIAGLRRGRLQIQASETIASYWLPARLVAFRRANPGLTISVAIGNSSEAVDAVLAGRVELGFIEGAVDDSALTVTDLAQDQLVVVVAPDHPWAGRKDLRPDEVCESVWVLREPGSGTRGIFEADLARIDVPLDSLDVALELPRNEAVISAVQAGLGATAVSANAAVAGLEAGLLVKVAMDLPVRYFRVVQQKSRRPSHAGSALLASIKS